MDSKGRVLWWGIDRYPTGDEQFLVGEEQRQLVTGNSNCMETVEDNID